ncbi:Solute carrier family 35 member G1 [Holothuria leucospilota]|uniref:Solute carrier family 35 member G1 n=1 Tax=Holothuria leucospilota TaxID=206669 RepID=A0A9Q1CUF7_HOLLE|nr:Solute carrier family 35 member G1 [Holothuria leucospilota]
MATTQTTDSDPFRISCTATESGDIRSEAISKVTVGDVGDGFMERKKTLEGESQKEGTLYFFKSSQETKPTFSCKSFAILRRRRGLLLASLPPLLFSVQSLLIDVLTETLDSFQVVFMHVPILMICCTVLVIYKGVRPSRDYKHYLWLLGSGTCQAGNTCFLALAVTYMAVGDTVTIMYTALIQVGFYSWLILKEPVRLFDSVFAILAFGGVIFIARPPFIFRIGGGTPSYDIPLPGVIIALAGSCTIAFFVVFNRKLSKLGVNSFFCLFFNATSVVLLSGAMSFILNRWRCPTMQEWLYALLAGVCYVFAHITLFYALKFEIATLVTVVSTTEIVYAYLWQLIFLRMPPVWTSYVGAILIFVAGIGITMKNKPPPSAPLSPEGMGAESS